VSFSGADSTGEIVTYEWQFGDGTLGFDVTTTHTYADSGVYTVTLKAYGTEASGLTNTASTTVEVTAPEPDVPFLVSVTQLVIPGSNVEAWRITFDSVPILLVPSVSITVFAANGAVLLTETPIGCDLDPITVCTGGIHTIHHHLGGYSDVDGDGYIDVGDYIQLRMSAFPPGSTFTLSAFSEVLVTGILQ
ncbi:MAG: PKD domain-containing protein, partial [Dehalococcoidia bacterium]